MADPGELLPWFQIGATLVTGIGVIISTALGILNIRIARHERQAKIKPFLSFNVGGQLVRCSLQERQGIPGVDADKAKEFLASRPENFECLVPENQFGSLVNHGTGPALDSSIWFEAKTVTFLQSLSNHERAGLKMRLTPWQKKVAPYSKEWNLIRANPVDINPGQEGLFSRIPTCVYAAMPETKEFAGTMHIECTDIEGNVHSWTQQTTVQIDRLPGHDTSVIISFDSVRR